MSGHIRRRGAGWELKFDTGVDQATGRRGTRYASFRGNKRQAQAKLTELLGESARGTLVDASKETLSTFLERWDRDWAVSNVSPKTMERYRQLIANQIGKASWQHAGAEDPAGSPQRALRHAAAHRQH
jgi:hypothetical protein